MKINNCLKILICLLTMKIVLIICAFSVYAQTDSYIILENSNLIVNINKLELTFDVEDKTSGKKWSQRKAFNELELIDYKKVADQVEMNVVQKDENNNFNNNLNIEISFDNKNKNELVVKIKADPNLPSIVFPYPFVDKNCELILPLNEGVIWPASMMPFDPVDFPLFSGNMISMPFFGAIDVNNGYMVMVETPDDAYIRVEPIDGIATMYPKWDDIADIMEDKQFKPKDGEDQKKEKLAEREIRYIFMKDCNIVKMAKKFREHIKKKGDFKKLKDKLDSPKKIDKLAGAVQIWSVSDNDSEIIREITQKEVDKIIWNNNLHGVYKELISKWGYLPALYENYSDVIEPNHGSKDNKQLTSKDKKAWNKKVINKNGDWKKGVQVNSEDISLNLGYMCDKFIPEYAKKASGNIKKEEVVARYIDNLVSIELNECYDPNHRMNKSQCKAFRKDALDEIGKSKSIVGAESGIYYAVNYCHYFVGMMSLSPFIEFDPKNINKISNEVSDQYQKIVLGHEYRIPLWELVYHDCVLTSWYPGDGNNNIPDSWAKKDLFNILYGTMPLYGIDDDIWKSSKEKIISSIKNVSAAIRKTIGREMTSFKYLKDDKTVQKTEFDNGHYVIVNYGTEDFKLKDNKIIKPMSYVENNLKVEKQKIEETKTNKQSLNLLMGIGIITLVMVVVIIIFYK